MEVKTISTLNELHEIFNDGHKTIIKIGTPHCGMCNVVENNIKEVIKTSEYSDWNLYVIDGDQCDEKILDELNVSNIPTTIFSYCGAKDIRSGMITVENLKLILNDFKEIKSIS